MLPRRYSKLKIRFFLLQAGKDPGCFFRGGRMLG